MKDTKAVFFQIINGPARKLILKWSENATDYISYVEEFGCGESNYSKPWDTLTKIEGALYEPVAVWLPERLTKENCGPYAHGVEMPLEYEGEVPEGFDIIELPACTYFKFQGEPFEDENNKEAIEETIEFLDRFKPEVHGYRYAPEVGPRMQVQPQGWRGYIELRPVEKL